MQTNKIIKKQSRVRSFLTWMSVLAIFAISAYFVYDLLYTVDAPLVRNSSFIKSPTLEEKIDTARYERKIYPYSIVRGGVQSREELYANIRTDNVVLEHYSDFDVDEARIIQAPETRSMYVSYRIGNEVYWTANAVKIPQGETLITDGTFEARARCGNRLSDTAMTPTSDEEPEAEFFDIPENDIPLSGFSDPDQFIDSDQTPLSGFPIGGSPNPLSGGNAPISSGFAPLGMMPGDYYSQYLPVILNSPDDNGEYNPVLPPDMPNLPYTPDLPGSPGVPDLPIVPDLPVTPDLPGLPDFPDLPGVPARPDDITDSPDLPGISTVPEPGTMVMLTTGLMAVAIIRFRRKKSK